MALSTPQRILMIAPTPFFSHRGTHIRILEEARALSRAGHRVTIATYHVGDDIPSTALDGVSIIRILPLLFWYRKREAGPSWMKIILDVQLFVRTFFLALFTSPTVIHAHLHEGAVIGWKIQKLLFWKKMKLVVDLHGSLSEELYQHSFLNSPFWSKRVRSLERWIHTLGDQVVCSSKELQLLVQNDRDLLNTFLLPDAVSEHFFQLGASKQELRTQYSLPQDKVLICYTGAFLSNKGMNLLIETLTLLKPFASDVHVVLAGAPRSAIESLLATKNLDSFVTVISPLSYWELPSILGACDIGIDPKSEDSHQASGKILHYMAASLPIVCSNRTVNDELFGEGVKQVTPFTPEYCAEVLKELITHPTLCEQMGKLNRLQASPWTWTTRAQQLTTLYEQ